MNSFSTSEDTKAYLSKQHADLVAEPYFELFQNKSPKVDAKTMEPALFPSDPSMEWCAPPVMLPRKYWDVPSVSLPCTYWGVPSVSLPMYVLGCPLITPHVLVNVPPIVSPPWN